MTGRIAVRRLFVFGGAYGNLEATRAMLAKASTLGYCPTEILFTGDSVAYCGNPDETAGLIRESGIHAIAGNCETALSSGQDDCGCGFEEGSTCDALSVEWYRYCSKQVGQTNLNWMASLPETLTFEIGRFRLLATHGVPGSNNRFVFASDIDATCYLPPSSPDLDGYIVGHSGLPFIRQTANGMWINSGASGMPANDGTDRVWYATLEAKGNWLSAETTALAYDVDSAQQAMLDAGLSSGYRNCLKNGIWPSNDVLPAIEREEAGRALHEVSSMFSLRRDTGMPEAGKVSSMV